MDNCKDAVEITMRAAVLDVTPEETKARQLKEAVDAAKKGIRPAPTQDVAAVETPAEEAPAAAETPEVTEAALDPAMVAAGEKVFAKCKACHQVGDGAKNRAGPILTGIVGSDAGGADGFKYSNALMSAAEGGLVWSEEELGAFLAKPRSYLKGTKMSFAGLKADDDIAAVIAYLKSFDR